MSKGKAEKKDSSSKKSGNSRAKGHLFFIFMIIAAAVFLPSSALLAVGMMPTIVAALTDWGPRKTRAVTVGAMNLAGCAPFLFQLWGQGHTFEASVAIFTDPTVIVVMYGAAAVGYLVDWSVSSMVAGIVFQQGLARQKFIKKRQEELVERWGPEVTGELPLDEQGFPIVPPASKAPARP